MSEVQCSVTFIQENSDYCGIRESFQWLFVEISNLRFIKSLYYFLAKTTQIWCLILNQMLRLSRNEKLD